MGPNGDPILEMHINEALKTEASIIAVGVHPSLFEFVSQFLAGLDSRVQICKIESKTMTETIVKVFRELGDSKVENIMVSLPDTINQELVAGKLFQKWQLMREQGNSLLTQKFLEIYRGKFGQVEVDQSTGKVVQILDKNPNCNAPFIWGGVSFKADLIAFFDITEPTVGNCINDLILKQGASFATIHSEGRYYDCGNFPDYLDALKI
jgi:NDP-sugar pyrophosphorylase family protein